MEFPGSSVTKSIPSLRSYTKVWLNWEDWENDSLCALAVRVSQPNFDIKQASSNPSFQELGSESRTNSFSFSLSRNSRGMSYAVSENCSSQTNLIFHLYLNADMHKLGTDKAQEVYVIS